MLTLSAREFNLPTLLAQHANPLGYLPPLDDLFGLPVTSGAVDILEGRQCAPGDALGRPHHTLWRALQLQLTYQAVIQPDGMLSAVHL
jgi:hypothetical protein